MDSDEQYLDEDYQFIESIKNKQKYDKKDDLEILELAVQIQNFHMPNWKNFPKSSMRKVRNRPKRHKTLKEKRCFKKLYSKLFSHVMYSAEDLVKIYNTYFQDAKITNVGFGKLKEVNLYFTKCRKRKNGKLHHLDRY